MLRWRRTAASSPSTSSTSTLSQPPNASWPTACQNGHSLNDWPHPHSSSAAGPACHR